MSPTGQKSVYLSFLLHANMCYDRYTKQEIRDKFPRIYAAALRAMYQYPEVTAHIDFPGLTWLSLKHYAPWVLDELKPLVDRGQVVVVGCQYAASHALCADEESDLVASAVSLAMLRDELQREVSTFFPQEIVFHPQMPYIMNAIGVQRLIVMPDGWHGPQRVRGIEGSAVTVYPLDLHTMGPGKLETYYDTSPDRSFVMAGGDFEQFDNLPAYVDEIRRLVDRGKIIRWTTVERYEQEVGIRDQRAAPGPFGQAAEDREPSPSFSRWVTHPEDQIWHGHAVAALDTIRTAGFAKTAAAVHGLGSVDVPVADAWTPAPDTPWDTRFEETGEYPETEALYLTPNGQSTLLSRAWHHLLIGLNSDASGWYPWTPRTRHRNTVLETSRELSGEVIARFAQNLSARLVRPLIGCVGWALALNPAPAREVDISLEVERPLGFLGADGEPIPTELTRRDGRWLATARAKMPAYGFRLLGLQAMTEIRSAPWSTGNEVALSDRRASLSDGRLRVTEGGNHIEVHVGPFLLRDPSGAASPEEVAPDWAAATTRVRETLLGPDLEVFTELSWAVWLRLVISLREDRVEIAAEVHVDMPRRIGGPRWNPAGLMLEFRGRPGRAFYDVPYATIEHPNQEPSFVAAQRFAAIASDSNSFAVIALGGNQSFRISAAEGILAASLGASVEGRPDTRPQCILRPDGSAEHKITSGGDPFLGTYEHRFALLFAPPDAAALTARRLRTAVPVLRVDPGNGAWPAEQSLLAIEPETAHVTAFRSDGTGSIVVLNDVGGKPSQIVCQGQRLELSAFGVISMGL